MMNIKTITVLLACAALAVAAPSASAEYKVRTKRPRILLKPTDDAPGNAPSIAAIKARLALPGWPGKTKMGPPRKGNHYLPNQALRALLDGSPDSQQWVIETLRKIKTIPDAVTVAGQKAHFVTFAYDWAYPLLEKNPEVKAQTEKWIADYIKKYLPALKGSYPLYHNFTYFVLPGLVAGSIDLVGTEYDELARKSLARLEELFEGEGMFFDVWEGQDGAWHEGSSYSYRVSYEMALATLVMDRALVKPRNYFAMIKRDKGDFFSKHARFWIQKSRGDRTVLRDGDCNPSAAEFVSPIMSYMTVVAGVGRDPVIKSWLDDMAVNHNRGYCGPGYLRHIYLLSYDPKLKIDKPWRKALPLASRYGKDDFEQIVFRGGWGEDDTHLAIRLGDRYTAHQHQDVGHIDLYHHGVLLVDSGFYAGGKHNHYSSRTVAHNSILVFDPQERIPGLPFADGGQRRAYLTTKGSTQRAPYIFNRTQRLAHKTKYPYFDAGNVVKYVTNDKYSYVAGDITAAYNSTVFAFKGQRPKVSKVRRDLLYLREKEIVVVLDRVVATDKSFRKQVLLHTMGQPKPAAKILGRKLPASYMVVDAVPNWRGKDCKGRMVVAPLLPADVRVNTVGGPGKEFVTAGRNFPFEKTDRHYQPEKHNPQREAGAWRIELSPGAPRAEDVFLTVLVLGTRDKLKLPVFAVKVGPDGRIELTVDDETIVLSEKGVEFNE